MQEEQLTRLNKYISESGAYSRREADRLIEEGMVTINGKTAELGSKVAPGDVVAIAGEVIQGQENPVYLAYNKPVGIICTTDPNIPDNIIEHVRYPGRVFPVGRLDVASEGLIFLTNDGDIVNKILRAGNNHEKEYIVEVHEPITREFIQKMGAGVPILDTVTKRCLVQQIDRYNFRIVLTQGLNRQIRRMCEYFGYTPVSLKRVRIMHIQLGDLPTGEWRHLTPDETTRLIQGVAQSSSTPLNGLYIKNRTPNTKAKQGERTRSPRPRRPRDE